MFVCVVVTFFRRCVRDLVLHRIPRVRALMRVLSDHNTTRIDLMHRTPHHTNCPDRKGRSLPNHLRGPPTNKVIVCWNRVSGLLTVRNPRRRRQSPKIIPKRRRTHNRQPARRNAKDRAATEYPRNLPSRMPGSSLDQKIRVVRHGDPRILLYHSKHECHIQVDQPLSFPVRVS